MDGSDPDRRMKMKMMKMMKMMMMKMMTKMMRMKKRMMMRKRMMRKKASQQGSQDLVADIRRHRRCRREMRNNQRSASSSRMAC